MATLSEPGMETDRWIGNACFTGYGRHIVVVYAPRHFTNWAALFARGAFAAVVDAKSGAVTKLEDQVSLAYFNPGCGADGTVALTLGASEVGNSTRLLTLDTIKKKITNSVVIPGQVSSAVPTGMVLVAARGNALVEVSESGKVKTLAKTRSLHPDGKGGVVYAEQSSGDITVRYRRGAATRTVATT